MAKRKNTLAWHHYHAMGFLLGAIALFLIGSPPATFADEEVESEVPVIMVLEHTENGKQVGVNIETTRGVFLSPHRGKPQPKWAIRPGHTLGAASRPALQVVELYQGTPREPILISRIIIKYFRNPEGNWVPHFLLNQEPLVVRVGKRWKPLITVQGVPNLLVITGNTLANAEGFYPKINFELSTGPLAIDFWVVK